MFITLIMSSITLLSGNTYAYAELKNQFLTEKERGCDISDIADYTFSTIKEGIASTYENALNEALIGVERSFEDARFESSTTQIQHSTKGTITANYYGSLKSAEVSKYVVRSCKTDDDQIKVVVIFPKKNVMYASIPLNWTYKFMMSFDKGHGIRITEFPIEMKEDLDLMHPSHCEFQERYNVWTCIQPNRKAGYPWFSGNFINHGLIKEYDINTAKKGHVYHYFCGRLRCRDWSDLARLEFTRRFNLSAKEAKKLSVMRNEGESFGTKAFTNLMDSVELNRR
jgi:hypothetical protein